MIWKDVMYTNIFKILTPADMCTVVECCGFVSFEMWPLLYLFLSPWRHLKEKASDRLRFLLLFCTYEVAYEEAVITADAAKNWTHTTTRKGHGWERNEQTYNPSCNDCDFLPLKKGFHCLNGTKWRSCRIQVTPSESFITGEFRLFYTMLTRSVTFFYPMEKTVWSKANLCISLYR